MLYHLFVHSTTNDSSTLYDVATDSSGKRSRPPLTAAAIRQMAIDETKEQLTKEMHKHADKLVDKAEQLHAKTAEHLAKLDRLAPKTPPTSVWTRGDQNARKPRFSRDDIAAAAIRIADSEGFEAVSMRRIAAELDAGTMTLYHYVRTKNELLTLVTDALMGEIALPAGTQLPADWRSAITLIAHRTRDAIRRHPWVLDINDDPQLGPNGVRHFDQTMQAVASLDVDFQTRIDLQTAVDEYVFGFCLQERNNNAGDDGGGLPPPMEAYLGQLLASGDYPALGALQAQHGLRGAWRKVAGAMRDDGRFDRNLSRLLDGFEHSFRR